jgi:hypothetical protein
MPVVSSGTALSAARAFKAGLPYHIHKMVHWIGKEAVSFLHQCNNPAGDRDRRGGNHHADDEGVVLRGNILCEGKRKDRTGADFFILTGYFFQNPEQDSIIIPN